jgi:thiosulfate dehydrogenase (quinone) large subunit
MPTTLETNTSAFLPRTLERMPAAAVKVPRPTGYAMRTDLAPRGERSAPVSPFSRRVGALGLLGLRLAIGFEFLWAFLDKTFGLGYSTPSAHAWIHRGSPTTGFLSGVDVGPLQGTFHRLAGVTAVDWLFMLGLLGVGTALVLGVALRPAAISGATLLALMYVASWPLAKLAGGQATGSVNPLVDDHIVGIMALVAIGAFAALSLGATSRRWSELAVVRSHSWLR